MNLIHVLNLSLFKRVVMKYIHIIILFFCSLACKPEKTMSTGTARNTLNSSVSPQGEFAFEIPSTSDMRAIDVGTCCGFQVVPEHVLIFEAEKAIYTKQNQNASWGKT